MCNACSNATATPLNRELELDSHLRGFIEMFISRGHGPGPGVRGRRPRQGRRLRRRRHGRRGRAAGAA